MKVAVLGLGHTGSVAAGCLAKQGHQVFGIDTNPEKVLAINEGRSPVVEPGLDELIGRARSLGRLSAATDFAGSLADCDIAFVCVGTPSASSGEHDLRQIIGATESLAKAISPQRNSSLTVAYRSTLRPGTCEEAIAPIFRNWLGEPANDHVEIVHHPEFLREGNAIEDYFNPSRVVIGTRDAQPCPRLDALYHGYDGPIFHVSIREAEMIKLVDNSWHAAKVAFANEIGQICQMSGVSAKVIHQLFVADTTLNLGAAYLRPGAPFGGSCLPKDVRALQQVSAASGLSAPLVEALLASNQAHKDRQLAQARSGLEPSDRLLLAGLAFKPGTDDLRESPLVDLAQRLIAAGFVLDIFDPFIEPARMLGQNLRHAEEHLPGLGAMLVDRATAERRSYARILAGNNLVDLLDIDRSKVLALCTIP